MDPTSRAQRESRAAFTLIEVMITVVIVGVLAAVAIPSYLSYRKRAKTVEPVNNLAVLYKGAASYYNLTFSVPDPVAGAVTQHSRCVTASSNDGVPMPATPNANGERVDFSTDNTFESLKFNVPDVVRYSYLVAGVDEPADQCTRPPGTAYTFSAFGDLDSDEVLSTFSFEVGVDNERGIYRAPNLDKTNELE